jgi:hypothetical protein
MFRLPGPAARAAAPALPARPQSGAALFAPLLLVRWGAVRRLAGWALGRLAPATAGAAVTRHALPAALGAADPAARRDALRALGELALYRPETAMPVEWRWRALAHAAAHEDPTVAPAVAALLAARPARRRPIPAREAALWAEVGRRRIPAHAA